jgi:hypothetical protein
MKLLQTFVLVFLLAETALAQPHNGVPTGALTYAGGVASGFASNKFITIPGAALPPVAPWTLEMWVKHTTTTWEGIVGGNWSMGRGPGPLAYMQVGGTAVYGGPDIVSPGTMQHLVMASSDGSSIRCFVNGIHIGSATVSSSTLTGPIEVGNASAAFSGEISEFVIWSIDKYPGTTTFTPTASWPDNTVGARAIYHFDANANDTFAGSNPLVSGTLVRVTGLEYSGFLGGSGSGSVQLQSYSGACSSGTFLNDGAALTSQSASTVVRWARDGTVKCYRVQVVVGAETVNSGVITSPQAGGGGSWSN